MKINKLIYCVINLILKKGWEGAKQGKGLFFKKNLKRGGKDGIFTDGITLALHPQ